MINILYLEDDINLNETITEFLEENDFNVCSVYDAQEALDELFQSSYDILLFDVNVPILDGFKLLEHLRDANITTPTIFTTALNSIDDLDKGYSSGCDDYLKKPFELKELLFRINALLKRKYNTISPKIIIDKNIYYLIKSKELWVDNVVVQLSIKEIKLLELFVQNPNKTIDFDTIYSTIWNYSEEYSEASLRVYIRNLRKYISKDKILNIKKQGYKFVIR